VPAQAGARRRRLAAAPPGDGRAATGAGRGPGPPRILGGRKERPAEASGPGPFALARARPVPRRAVLARLPALPRVAERGLLPRPVATAHRRGVHPRARPIRLPRALRDQARAEEHLPARAPGRHLRVAAGARDLLPDG